MEHLRQWTVTLPYLKTDSRLAFLERTLLAFWHPDGQDEREAFRKSIGAVKNLRKAVRAANSANITRVRKNDASVPTQLPLI